jgi:L-2-hydroxyglutarate oxidase
MHKYDYCVVGAGIVGLASAFALLEKNPKSKILILEKESIPGFHQTGHNSGVIHAGVYYPPGSLKAILCRQGLIDTKAFCSKYNINFNQCGKLIVATNQIEVERLESLYKRSLANDIKLERISNKSLAKKEPNILGLEALFSPETSIVDYQLIADRLIELLTKKGVHIKFNSKVLEIFEDSNSVNIKTDSNQISCQKLVVCGGLQADRLAELSGLKVDFRILPFRGEYYKIRRRNSSIVNHLIYPVPDPDLPFLGVHLTRMIDGSVTIGPNAVIGFSREGYKKGSFNFKDFLSFSSYPGFWKLIFKYRQHAIHEFYGSISKRAFLKECQKYCPSLSLEDLLPHPAGIRAQAVHESGILIHDFMFKQTKRMLHVCNAPSPAATSAFPIGKMIAEKCGEI